MSHTTTLVEITHEGPCAGHLDALLTLMGDSESSGRHAATRAHLRGCHRCKAFVETVRLERRAGASLSTDIHASALREAEPLPDDSKQIRKWIDQELKWRSERECADALWRLGRALVFQDANVRRHVPLVDDSGEDVDAAVAEIECAARLVDSRGGSSRTRRPHGGGLRGESSLDSPDRIQAIARAAIRGGRPTRVEAARQCIAAAHSLSGGCSGKAALLDALLEWYYGDDQRVPDRLSDAEEHASEPITRSHALTSLATWHVDHGMSETGFELGRAARRAAPDVFHGWFNAAVWGAYFGCENSIQSSRRLRQLMSHARLVREYPSAATRACLHAINIKYGSGRIDDEVRVFGQLARSLYRGESEGAAP